MKNYQTKKYEAEALGPLQKLMLSDLPSIRVSGTAYLSWQYFKNPAGKPFIRVAENDDAEIVAQYIVIPQAFSVHNAREKATLSLNTLTREDYRGMGLFPQLAGAVYNDCAAVEHTFTIGFPNKFSHQPLVKKLDFVDLGNVPLLIKVLRPIAMLKQKLNGNAPKHGKEFLSNNLAISLLQHVSWLNPAHDTEAYERFLNLFNAEKKILSMRSMAYLQWRYLEHPLHKYQILKYTEAGEIKGIIILRAAEVLGFHSGIILDLMLAPGLEGKKAGSQLLKNATSIFNKLKLHLSFGIMLPQHPEFKLMQKAFYLKVPEKVLPQKIPFLVRVNKKTAFSADLLNADNWFLGLGDYDVF